MATLTQISVPTKEQVNTESQTIFDQLKGQLGMVPNLYATIGYSSNALSSFLAFSGNAGKDTFSNKEIEAIKLAVSQANDCTYCKSAHTAIAKMNGFTEEETAQLRTATIEDEKLNVLTNLAKEVAEKAGHATDETRELFFALGYDEKALIEFVSVVVSVTFTNYVHALTKVAVDFPVVK
ncbi:MAG: carboxymuconolactone decarboxylase family protein [Cytophagales bacterium]|nr:carboxymuconolactone decarboxylase family protein [Cytophagales bacterium]